MKTILCSVNKGGKTVAVTLRLVPKEQVQTNSKIKKHSFLRAVGMGVFIIKEFDVYREDFDSWR